MDIFDAANKQMRTAALTQGHLGRAATSKTCMLPPVREPRHAIRDRAAETTVRNIVNDWNNDSISMRHLRNNVLTR